MSSAKDANQRAIRQQFNRQLAAVPALKIANDRSERLVGLAADEDPELGFIGVLGLKDVVRACEEYQVASARVAGWTWAQIAAALHVTPRLHTNDTLPNSRPATWTLAEATAPPPEFRDARPTGYRGGPRRGLGAGP
jgi:hypothetical protein